MPGVSRVNQDSAGGLISQALATSVYVDGKNITVKGAQVTPHGSGAHASATMSEASSSVFAEGIAICREGDKATCNDPTTGSSDVFAG